MRKIEIELYSFNELSEEVQQKVIERERNLLEDSGDYNLWVLDDCSLFEPEHDELVELLGNDYKFPLLENNRKAIYYDLSWSNRYIQIEHALNITNKKHFLYWLGLPSELLFQYSSFDHDFDFDIISKGNYSCSILVFHGYDDEYEPFIKKAKEKFGKHIETILKRIEDGIEFFLSDENIEEMIEYNDYKYLKNGKEWSTIE